jgi:uncharacterized protein (UPF0333 family)
VTNRVLVLLLAGILVALIAIAFVLVTGSQQAWNAAHPSATIDIEAAGRAVQTWVATQTMGASG